jgi:hypothetical protein
VRRAFENPVLEVGDVWLKGRQLMAWAPRPGNGAAVWQAIPLDGGPATILRGGMYYGASPAGNSLSFNGPGGVYNYSYIVPGEALARFPPGGVKSDSELARLPGVRRIDARAAVTGSLPDIYAFHHGTIQRNLYRIPIPRI